MVAILAIAINPEPISTEEILRIVNNTQSKLEEIDSYKFLLVKRELIDGKDTGYQYLNVKVQVKPLQIYVEFLKPARLQGRRALYTDGKMVVRRGGTRLSNLTLHIQPDSPLAMDGNKYPITHINPASTITELVTKIKQELKVEGTKLEVYRRAKVFEQSGTHYVLANKNQKAEIMIADATGLPIYFRVTINDVVVEEYAFRDMEVNVDFADMEFSIDNPKYEFNEVSQ